MKMNKNSKKLKNTMKIGNSSRIIAGILTLAIIGLLIFAGPAQAFVLGLTADKEDVKKGETITFNATLDIQSMDKYLPVEHLELHINGPESVVCKFDINGKIINEEGCEGMEIERIYFNSENYLGYGYGYGYGQENSYGYGYEIDYGYGYNFGYDYGYGYGYGAGGKEINLIYKITLDTISYEAGDYISQLKADIGGEIFASKSKPEFTVISSNSFSGQGGSGSDNGENNDTIGGLSSQNNGDSNGNGEEPDEKDEPPTTFFSRLAGITGAVIGALGTTGTTVVVIFLVGLLGSAITVRQIRKRKKL